MSKDETVAASDLCDGCGACCAPGVLGQGTEHCSGRQETPDAECPLCSATAFQKWYGEYLNDAAAEAEWRRTRDEVQPSTEEKATPAAEQPITYYVLEGTEDGEFVHTTVDAAVYEYLHEAAPELWPRTLNFIRYTPRTVTEADRDAAAGTAVEEILDVLEEDYALTSDRAQSPAIMETARKLVDEIIRDYRVANCERVGVTEVHLADWLHVNADQLTWGSEDEEGERSAEEAIRRLQREADLDSTFRSAVPVRAESRLRFCADRYRKEQKLTYFDIYRKAQEIDQTLTEAEWDAIMYSEGEDG